MIEEEKVVYVETSFLTSEFFLSLSNDLLQLIDHTSNKKLRILERHLEFSNILQR